MGMGPGAGAGAGAAGLPPGGMTPEMAQMAADMMKNMKPEDMVAMQVGAERKEGAVHAGVQFRDGPGNKRLALAHRGWLQDQVPACAVSVGGS